jgi:hypothetical protein
MPTGVEDGYPAPDVAMSSAWVHTEITMPLGRPYIREWGLGFRTRVRFISFCYQQLGNF